MPPSVNNIPETRFETVATLFFSFALPTDAFVDPEGIPLAITILAAPGKTLPNFLEFSASTLTVSGKTTKKNLGDYEFVIRATDNNAQSVDVTISLTVKFISEQQHTVTKQTLPPHVPKTFSFNNTFLTHFYYLVFKATSLNAKITAGILGRIYHYQRCFVKYTIKPKILTISVKITFFFIIILSR